MVDQQTFRQVMGNFAAGVTVVTLPEPYHGITVNSFASLSLEPILVLICIDHDTETHVRLAADEPGFCVNLLAADQQHLGEYFAGMRDLDVTPFDSEATRTASTGAPVFEESVGYLDCSVFDAFGAGDHTIYIGEVQSAELLRPDAPVLTYFRGDWGAIGT